MAARDETGDGPLEPARDPALVGGVTEAQQRVEDEREEGYADTVAGALAEAVGNVDADEDDDDEDRKSVV